MEPTVQFIDPVLLIAHWNNFQIVDQGGMLLSEHVRALTAQTIVMNRRFPKMMGTISILRPDTRMSPKPVRDELAAMMKAVSHLETQTVVVLESSGIIASVLRTTLRTVMVMSGNRKLQVVATVAEALPLLLTFVRGSDGARVTAHDVESIVLKARAHYDAQRLREGAARHP